MREPLHSGSGLSAFLGSYRQTLMHLEKVADEGCEFDPKQERTPERLVAAVWFDQKLDHEHLRTADGRKLRVISPGRWNTGPGPDFKDAAVRMAGGPTLKGDIEVHVFASDWQRHRHSEDPRYSDVILHAVMWNDVRRKPPQIPVVEMFPYLLDERILTAGTAAEYPHASGTMAGKCAPLIDRSRMDKALQFIAAAGDSRIDEKASRMDSLARAFGLDQTLYKGLMEAVGYSANKKPLSHLADTLHLDILRSAVAEQPLDKRVDVILALIYGCSGFFERYADDLSEPYLAGLLGLWRELGAQRKLIPIRGIKLSRTRPANNPYRRMAAVARLLGSISGLKLFDYYLSQLGKVENLRPSAVGAAGRRLRDVLTSIEDPFWDLRLTPRGPALKKPQKLIGEGLASVIVVNIIVPLMLAHARQKQNRDLEVFLHQVLCRFSGQGHNSLTRFTCSRILGTENREPRFATNARLHQGLLQIYYDFCRDLRRGCDECDFMDFLATDSV